MNIYKHFMTTALFSKKYSFILEHSKTDSKEYNYATEFLKY